jgi:hypothetical protein
MVQTLTAAVVGGVLGYGWHKLVGCRSGTCPITANPYTSVIYGVVVGVLTSGLP